MSGDWPDSGLTDAPGAEEARKQAEDGLAKAKAAVQKLEDEKLEAEEHIKTVLAVLAGKFGWF